MLLDERARGDDVRGRDGKCRFKFCIYNWPIVVQKHKQKHLSAHESAAQIGDYAKLIWSSMEVLLAWIHIAVCTHLFEHVRQNFESARRSRCVMMCSRRRMTQPSCITVSPR
jgi:hypothetical protein